MKKTSPADLKTTSVTIRPASLADLPQINRIYNHYVDNSSATFALAPESEENRLAWFKSHEQSGHPILALVEDEAVIGWASLSAYNTRCGYAGTVELSIYLSHEKTGLGHGERLFEALMKSAEAGGYHAVLSIACSENIASIKLAERHGFKKVGEIKEVGRKFERWLDVTFMEKILSER